MSATLRRSDRVSIAGQINLEGWRLFQSQRFPWNRRDIVMYIDLMPYSSREQESDSHRRPG